MKKRTIIIFRILILNSINKTACPGCLSRSRQCICVFLWSVYIFFIETAHCFSKVSCFMSHKHLSLFKKIVFHTGFLIIFFFKSFKKMLVSLKGEMGENTLQIVASELMETQVTICHHLVYKSDLMF